MVTGFFVEVGDVSVMKSAEAELLARLEALERRSEIDARRLLRNTLDRDAAVRAALEEASRQAAKDVAAEKRRQSTFLAEVAHELRNALAPVSASVSLITSDSLPSESVQAATRMIGRQARHMVRLVNDLLDSAAVDAGTLSLQKQTTDVRQLIDSTLEMCKPGIDSAKQELRLIVSDEPMLLDADATRLTQALTNVLNNAIKYTPPAGLISLTARRDEHQVVIEIKDNGVGMPPWAALTIFEAFSQLEETADRRAGGVGIGLALVRKIVELHRGSIEAMSDGIGRGSAFTIRLPLA